MHFRSLRSTHSSHKLRDGARPEVVRDILGHASIDVTQNVYGKSEWMRSPKLSQASGRAVHSTQTIASGASARRILARRRQFNGGVTLRVRGCDDYAACDDEQSADEHCQRWNLLERQPRDGLSGEKEKHHVAAEQFAEVPGRRIDSPSAYEPHERRDDFEGEVRVKATQKSLAATKAC